MSVWNQALDAAGVREPGLRHDYSAQRQVVARYRRTSYLAARMLLPRPMLPHVIAMTAFMHHGDNLLDSGPQDGRADAWAEWEKRVREALETGESDQPLIHAVVHTVATLPRTRGHIEAYLATASAELEFAGFATDADYAAYVDAYTLPAFMLIAGLLAPEDDDTQFRAACRTYIDGSQRLDFVNDLAEDLREGRFAIPAETLEHFGVAREDLASGEDLPGVRELLRSEIGRARETLTAARPLAELTPPAYRPMVRALIEVELLTAKAAEVKEADLLRAPAGPSAPAALRVLLREYRQARRVR
jgi:15-cis-phytoene synthase